MTTDSDCALTPAEFAMIRDMDTDEMMTRQADNDHYRPISPAFLMRDDDGEAQPLVRGLLYPGLITTISSWPGVGKTTLGLSLIIAMIRREKALGLLQTGPLGGPVVYLT